MSMFLRLLISIFLLGTALSLAAPTSAYSNNHKSKLSKTSVLWISDLYDPADDPDDHYDFAVGFSDSKMRPGVFVIDDASLKNSLGSNAPAIDDLAKITGLPKPLVLSMRQTRALDRWIAAQPDNSIDIVSVGSLTAISNLLDRNGDLLKRKVRQVLVIAGNGSVSDIPEHNVRLNPQAFVKVMTSNLPIRWVPCFDGQAYNPGTSSYTISSDDVLTEGLSPQILSWFQKYVGDQWGKRQLWGAGIIIDNDAQGASWKRVEVSFNDFGGVDESGRWKANVERLVVTDRIEFESWLINKTNEALKSLVPATRKNTNLIGK
jgi:hypothetical protein